MPNFRLSKKVVGVVVGLALGAVLWWQTAVSPANNLTTPIQEKTIITFADFAENNDRYDSLIAEFNQQHDMSEVQFVPVSSESFQQGDFSIYLDELVTS
ncbi:MAG: hypothetical protein KC434_18700, partial [Anaerolineales bacterium]|nr:hypothetical protein [Anaerolineales bacterium]